jgi:hypothetical protein
MFLGFLAFDFLRNSENFSFFNLQDSRKSRVYQAKLALNTKWVMASPFGITRQILFLLQVFLVRQTKVLNLFCMRKTMTFSGFEPGTFGFQVDNVPN